MQLVKLDTKSTVCNIPSLTKRIKALIALCTLRLFPKGNVYVSNVYVTAVQTPEAVKLINTPKLRLTTED